MHIEKEYGPEAAENPKLVRQISLECRQRMQAAIDDMLLRRRSIFYGAIFDGPSTVRQAHGRPEQGRETTGSGRPVPVEGRAASRDGANGAQRP
jgi:hypothetical protein